jgi:glycerophosphoryl diester phosphodiesterase/MFS family permease
MRDGIKQMGQSRWVALFVLTALNILNYIDRNIYAALVPAIQKDLGFSDAQVGLLGSAFIFAYMFAAPFFGHWGDRGSRSGLMASGVAIWSFATAASGLTLSYFGQLISRSIVGIGEASYSVIAPTVIADHFSRASRGRVFAIYSCAIPVGSALGYVIGGWLEPRFGWQNAFFIVGIPGLVCCSLLLLLKNPPRGLRDVASAASPDSFEPLLNSEREAQVHSIRKVYRLLFANGGFLCTVLGYAAFTFVVGGIAFWMPSYIVRYFDGVGLEKANLVFGGITVVAGFIGTALGGLWADRVESRSGNGYLKVSFLAMLLSTPLFLLTLSFRDFTSFAVALFFLEVALFLCISPLDAAVLNSVRPEFRATASALNILLIHALGDGISRILLGAISDASDLRTAVSVMPWVLLVAALFWAAGIVFFWQALPWPEMVGRSGLRSIDRSRSIGDSGRQVLTIPRFQAHRGYRPSAEIQENTLAAFRLAQKAGAEMVECDVHLSKDRVPVIFHDPDLVRIGGSPELVADLTAEEMQVKVGAPRLRELLDDLDSPRLVNIELKSMQILGSDVLEREVVRAVRESRAEDRVIFSSFNPFCLRRLAQLAPSIPRALLVSNEKHPKNRIWLRKMWLGAWARPHLVHLDKGMSDRERIARCRDRGISVVVWTVNDPKKAEELLSFGARGIISDVLFR